jgi:Sulfotransferase family
LILSHKYHFIFLKTSKTAGTSIEIGLSKFCDEGDIITPISPADEKVRRRLGYRGPQNYHLPQPSGNEAMPPASYNCERFSNHVGAKKVRRCLGDILWNNYYKFCFERNPWDRFISFYYWRCRNNPNLTIDDLLASGHVQRLKRFGFNTYTINGKVAVNRICLYEDLGQELDLVRERLGLPEVIELPHTKASFRKDRRSYRDILSERQRQQIAELFSNEIAMFGYQF